MLWTAAFTLSVTFSACYRRDQPGKQEPCKQCWPRTLSRVSTSFWEVLSAELEGAMDASDSLLLDMADVTASAFCSIRSSAVLRGSAALTDSTMDLALGAAGAGPACCTLVPVPRGLLPRKYMRPGTVTPMAAICLRWRDNDTVVSSACVKHQKPQNIAADARPSHAYHGLSLVAATRSCMVT